MEYKLIELESILDDAMSYIHDARDVIEEDIFGNEKPVSPYDGWLKKMEEAIKILQSILDDDHFKTMLAEEEKQCDIDCDKADGQSY